MEELLEKLILIIDHDKKGLEAAWNALEGSFRVWKAKTVEEGLEVIKGNHPEVILLDMSDPGMNGMDFFKSVIQNEDYEDIPVICTADMDDGELESKCLDLGAADFITKPYRPAALKSRVGRAIDISGYKKAAHRTAIHDNLTGLYNRSYGEERIKKLLKDGKAGSFLMIDLDNFKGINDAYGHLSGDDVLRIFGGILEEISGEQDVAARMGGDEFIIFFAGITGKIAIMDKASKILEKMSEGMNRLGFGNIVTVSIGISLAPEDADEYGLLYKYADKALYGVKRRGKDDYAFYSDEPHEAEEDTKIIDLDKIRYILEGRMDWHNGAFQVDYGDFRKLYDYIYRGIRRNGQKVQIILFTFNASKETRMSDVDEAMRIFEHAVLKSLRMVDVGTRYSTLQYIVILLDTNVENGKMVADRVVGNFHHLYEKGDIKVQYDIETMIPKISTGNNGNVCDAE